MEKDVAHKAMHDKVLIEEEFVETRPERVPMKCTADDVAIHQVKKYFSFDGWKVVMNVYKVLKERGEWECRVCRQSLQKSISVGCDGCLEWYHLRCLGLDDAPKRKTWFCRACFK